MVFREYGKRVHSMKWWKKKEKKELAKMKVKQWLNIITLIWAGKNFA